MRPLNSALALNLLIGLTLVCPLLASAAGPSGGGGGDPRAVEFLANMKAVSAWMLRSNTPISIAEAKRAEQIVKDLTAMMDDPALTPIEFTDEKLSDESGAKKAAKFSFKPIHIKVNEDEWKALVETEKYVTAGLELFGLAGISARYGTADLIRQRMADIQKLADIASNGWEFESLIRAGDIVIYKKPGIYSNGAMIYPIFVFNYDAMKATHYESQKLEVDLMCMAYGHPGGIEHQPSDPSVKIPAAGVKFTPFTAASGGSVVSSKTPRSTELPPEAQYALVESLSCRIK